MVSERNRIVKVKEYIESFGIDVNISKNKAQGNRGFFKAHNNKYRIDIARGLSNENIVNTLVHEFTHFIHYKYDIKLQDLDFLFGTVEDSLIEDMLKVTVDFIPKEQAKTLFNQRVNLKKEIKILAQTLTNTCSDFKLSTGSKKIEKELNKTIYKYLLKYDRVKIPNFFSSKIYSINDIKNSTELPNLHISYLVLKSKQRALKRINSRISKLNRYYNSPTELLARSIELYVSDNNKLKESAPLLHSSLKDIIDTNKIPELTKLVQLTETKS